MSPRKTLEQKREALSLKKLQLEERIKKIDSIAKTQSRKIETRKKIIAGAILMSWFEQKNKQKELNDIFNEFLVKAEDRILFGLDPK